MGSLKSFIKAVRASKTIADERAVIRKESAAIRTSFRDVALDQPTRRVNISKLLYLYILGEKTHFGQVECLKLLASQSFGDKRLGYLAVMLLLDENQEVLTLLTNSLDNDMGHPNQAVVGLALCTLGNVASPELALDLYQNVEKILASGNPYLRKKAAVVAAKLVEKDADLAEAFLPHVAPLLADKNHGPLLGALALLRAVHAADATSHALLRRATPALLVHLKKLQAQGYSPEHDVLGVADPFLQVSLLQTLRTLNEHSDEHLEQLNDVLTQVASNIEPGKNSSHAVLYEAVKTIFQVRSDSALRVLGINILGKFLGTKDNNTRYVALNTLLTVLHSEPQAVQRHRSTIVHCLSDGDISIRRRALELTFAIVNEQNIRVLVREVLTFLENSDSELKPYITAQLCVAADKYAPNAKWHFDTLIRMLRVAGNHVTSDIVSNILALVMQNEDLGLTKHVVQRLYQASVEDLSQFGLNLVAVWCVGEYGDYLINTTYETDKGNVSITEDSILDFLYSLINNTTYSDAQGVQLTSYVLTAVLKLSVKFTQTATAEKLRRILNASSNSINLEIQIRAIEYQEIFSQPLALRKGLLERMPAPPVKRREGLSLNSRKVVAPSGNSSAPASDLLLDLMDDSVPAAPQQSADLLSDIFGSTPAPSAKNEIMDLFAAPSASQSKPSQLQVPSSALLAHSNSHVKLYFNVQQLGEGTALIDTLISNVLAVTVSDISMLIAVPKSQKLQLSNISSPLIQAGGTAKQTMKVNGKEGGKLKLRIKLGYSVDGQAIEEQFDFGGFGRTL
ncbi:hypothetical protein BABINDRAFT_162641 [Babjeviella inositovora NRRL Y-12698]|uniref:AP-1 complex subunit gamma n=1 Tax=Babjeviella inositovora NRRL Y-12698 TaxID=984486 RepID=A0A1E3QL53_9ASCO|nr:uncharacterized protein BABINDRAFT_162641 [Babjeviella inositovora NRRL Y-12698]ODQ78411.1 hypothetical protein BABINDRAFT_162641 [Babjeviella inositovora NRRL Y-12698]